MISDHTERLIIRRVVDSAIWGSGQVLGAQDLNLIHSFTMGREPDSEFRWAVPLRP